MNNLHEKIKDIARPYKWGYKTLLFILSNHKRICMLYEENSFSKNIYDYYINTNDFVLKMENLLKNFTIEDQKYIKFLFARAISNYPVYFLTKEEEEHSNYIRKNFTRKIKKEKEYYIYENYKLPINFFCPDIFLEELGLKFLQNKEKLIGTDFIDAGAFVGDSSLILSKYKPKNIYAFEPVDKNFQLLNLTINLNNSKKIIPVKMALADFKDTRNISDNDNKSNLLHYQNDTNTTINSEKIEIDSLDNFVFDNNLNPGLIKADIEGSEFSMIKGAYKTIKKFKPAMIISIYHTGKDFFEIKPLIDSWNLGYSFKIVKNSYNHYLYDTVLICECLD